MMEVADDLESVHLVYICFGGMDHVDMIYFGGYAVVPLNAV
jgi:hypothetical protein